MHNVCTIPRQGANCRLDLARCASLAPNKCDREAAYVGHEARASPLVRRIARIDQDADSLHLRNDLEQNLQLLRGLSRSRRKARHITTWMSEALRETDLDRVADRNCNDGDCIGY